jgi:hypothetical protein
MGMDCKGGFGTFVNTSFFKLGSRSIVVLYIICYFFW